MSTSNNLSGVVRVAENPDRLALIDLSDSENSRRLTFRELDRLVSSAAWGLVERGFQPGDAIGVYADNSTEYLVALLGIMRAGMVAVPINHKQPAPTVEFILHDAKVKAVYCDKFLSDGKLPSISLLDLQSLRSSKASDSKAFENVCMAPGEIAMILYTSGSTGRPKGVVLTHDSQYAMIRSLAGSGAFTNMRVAVAAPFFHMNGLVFSEVTLFAGGSIVLFSRFETRDFLTAIETYDIKCISGVPTILTKMAQEKDLVASLDLSGVSLVYIGSAPLSVAVLNQTRELFPNAMVLNGYGTTETGAGFFGPHPDGLPRPPLSLGYPAKHAELRLVDGANEREGVLELKWPGNMLGYHNRPDLTAERVQKGWYHTGDVMRRDENGFFFFVGREDDMFVCNGENIYPGEVEKVLESHPEVLQACVVGVADVTRGAMPVAFIVKAANSSVKEQELKGLCLRNLPAYMHPRQIHFLETLPLSSTNKIDRKGLLAQAEALNRSGES